MAAWRYGRMAVSLEDLPKRNDKREAWPQSGAWDLERTELDVRGSGRKEFGAVNCASAEPERTSSIRKSSKKAMPVERGNDPLEFKRVKKGTFQLAF